jgi:hypothetical protein
MLKVLKGCGIFAAMAAVPILADNLISKRPDIPLFAGFSWPLTLLPVIMVFAIIVIVVFAIILVTKAFWKFEEEIAGIQGNLKLAERELTKYLADSWDQAGRKGRVEERAQWAAMAHPTVVHIVKNADGTPMAVDPAKWGPTTTPSFTQVYNEGYRTVAHEAFELNRADMANRGATMGKASMTALLLRELYQGSPGRALKKISGEFKSGGTPFVAPGIRELLDFDKFDKDEKRFAEDHKPVNWLMLTLAVKQGQFPKELRLLDRGEILEGWIVIKKLTEPTPPKGWDGIPKKPAPISMWWLWLEWLTTWE